MEINGFDERLGAIPMGSNGFVSNGAHRVAVASVLGLKVAIEKSPERSHPYDQEFLLSIGLSPQFIDLALLETARAVKETRFLVLFDSDQRTKTKLRRHLRLQGLLWGYKDIELSIVGQRRLIFELYGHNEWFTYELVDQLVEERMSSPESQITFFQIDNRRVGDFQALKERLREEFLGSRFPRKLHGTDGESDSSNLAELVYSKGGRVFLNTAPLRSEDQTLKRFADLDLPVKGHLNEWVVSGSTVLELHGGRQAADLDLIFSPQSNPRSSNQNYDCHNTYVSLNPFPLEMLVYGSHMFFVYRGIKFLSKSVVLSIKIYLGGEKNSQDVYSSLTLSEAQTPSVELAAGMLKIRKIRARRMRWIARLEWGAKRLPVPVENFLRKAVRLARKIGRQVS
ncbi:hypothetical protein N9M34_00540 [Aquiluna sp.]|nr:hypothetical protein [Aquiluna sp.]